MCPAGEPCYNGLRAPARRLGPADGPHKMMEAPPGDIPLILASSSRRRRSLLREAGIAFETVAPPIHEPDEVDGKLPPVQQAEALAYFKARAVQQRMRRPAFVLGADTIVLSAPGHILGKPADAGEARGMLQALSNTTHDVITGVAILGPNQHRIIASEVTRVTMRPVGLREIDEYIDSGEWKGKAGAYAIQETADKFIANLDGSFSNVVGLPIELVTRMLAELRRHREAHRTE